MLTLPNNEQYFLLTILKPVNTVTNKSLLVHFSKCINEQNLIVKCYHYYF